MKKITVVLLILALALAGCSAPVTPVEESSVAESSAVFVKDYDYILDRLKLTAGNSTISEYAYARHDINGDGVEEFITLCDEIEYVSGELRILDIYTIKDGAAVTVWRPEGAPNYWAFPTADGTFYWAENSTNGGIYGKYQNASSEYAPTLDDLYRYAFAYEMYHKENDRTDSWYMEFLNGVWSHDRVETSKLGYREMDINKDGIAELITGIYDENDGFSLIAIWTLKDGKPVHVDGFGGRYRGVLLDDGSVFTYGSGGAQHFGFDEVFLAPHATEWTKTTEYTMCDEYKYKKQNDRYIYITSAEFRSLGWNRFERLEKNAKLKITPIL